MTSDHESLRASIEDLRREMELSNIKLEHLIDELEEHQREICCLREEIERIEFIPLVIVRFIEMVDDIFGTTIAGFNYRVLYTPRLRGLPPPQVMPPPHIQATIQKRGPYLSPSLLSYSTYHCKMLIIRKRKQQKEHNYTSN